MVQHAFDPASAMPGTRPCPHGNHHGHTRPDAELGQACTVCGGPRVAVNAANVRLSGREVEPLRRAGRLRASRALWRGGGAFAAVASALGIGATLLSLLIFGFGLWATGLPLLLTAPWIALAFVALGKSGTLSAGVSKAVDAAWRSAARDAVEAAGRPMTAAELAPALGLDEQHTERLLTELSVTDELRSEVTTDGRLSYAPSLRIEVGAPPPDSLTADAELEARFDALAEAEAEAARARKPAC